MSDPVAITTRLGQKAKAGALEPQPGGAFLFDHEPTEAVWGTSGQVAWSAGEPLLVVGPSGIGHTTLLDNLLLARVGILAPVVLGMPVVRDERPGLLLAADRPAQARRSLRRMVTEADRANLDEHLIVHAGATAFHLACEPERLIEDAVALGVGTVAIDALKDVAPGLTDDEVGSGVARALNGLVTAGLEVIVCHHNRKAQADNRKPRALDDVYGSAWITAAAGSVLLLWGKAGDPVVELTQLKQADGEVGPLKVLLDFETGLVEVLEGSDPLAVLRAAPNGLSALEAARLLYADVDKPAEMRAKRQLVRLESQGLAYRREGTPIRGAIREPDRFFATSPQGVMLP